MRTLRTGLSTAAPRPGGRITIVWALVLVAGLLPACDSSEREAASTASEAEEPRSAGETPPEPATHPSGEPERVSFSTMDGVTIVGTLRRGGHPEAPAVVLVHQLSQNREEWAPIVKALAEPPGLTTLALDLRGHGESTGGLDGATLDWRQFQADDFLAMANDVVAAINFLGKDADLRPSRIVAVGSSIGSSAVIVAAARDERIGAVAAVSPGRAYRGVDALTPVQEIGTRPVLAVASEGEEAAVEAAQAIAHLADRSRVALYPGSAHGLAILRTAPDMADDLVGFVRDPL